MSYSIPPLSLRPLLEKQGESENKKNKKNKIPTSLLLCLLCDIEEMIITL